MTHRIIYPTAGQIDLACAWSNQGPKTLDGATVAETSEKILVLRDLVFRLDLPAPYEGMRERMRPRYNGPYASVGTRLLDQILATLRYHGYIYPTGPENRDRARPYYARTPLTGYRLHVIRLLASGSQQSDIAPVFGVSRQTVTKNLELVRADFGCATTVQLVALAYARRWLPTFDESLKLTRGDVRPEGKAYRVVGESPNRRNAGRAAVGTLGPS